MAIKSRKGNSIFQPRLRAVLKVVERPKLKPVFRGAHSGPFSRICLPSYLRLRETKVADQKWAGRSDISSVTAEMLKRSQVRRRRREKTVAFVFIFSQVNIMESPLRNAKRGLKINLTESIDLLFAQDYLQLFCSEVILLRCLFDASCPMNLHRALSW